MGPLQNGAEKSCHWQLGLLHSIIPALKRGAKLIINDRVIPSRGQAHYLVEREARDYYMYMLAFQNAKERTTDDWAQLFEQTDSRFELTKVSHSGKSKLAVVEVTWKG
ncbi:S-adenosyl-L-methionine-dependent methyltransferase [Penicillium canariense]|uniref:S-adenosyl-L-methionine-dependent methyltransferase n=1 Tax=Penicillium canariense TaxID=189055 RepID=A0A9W9HN00_9EURO|nr:S-adenosyl-L-methionine-dependent methyltransferase [Penicillium canariense]KAJ5153213.1 S-adenosyl-L-methionine-dependent methyltransferase [Penicillium canariense]